MVGIGTILLALAILGAYLRSRGHLFTRKWFLVALVLASPLGFIATIAGWVVTEAGRQPYVVYGMVRTADAASHLAAASVGTTLSLFVVAYIVLMAGFLWFLIQTIIRGPEPPAVTDAPKGSAGGRIRATPEFLERSAVMLAYSIFAIIAVAVLLYVLMDGWDLGVGVLFLVATSDAERDEMMESIVPFWDGNETWLVFAGVTLFGAFPVVYASALQYLYLPVMVMLFALVFRGISFEFRGRVTGSKVFCNWIFSLSSIVVGFTQGTCSANSFRVCRFNPKLSDRYSRSACSPCCAAWRWSLGMPYWEPHGSSTRPLAPPKPSLARLAARLGCLLWLLL